jgi:nitrogen regulatory protein PII-like uncharacterized protein
MVTVENVVAILNIIAAIGITTFVLVYLNARYFS